MNIIEIKNLFEAEFEPVRSKFEIYNLPLAEAEHSNELHIWKPGVYIFWHPIRGVIKVGRSLDNSRKRAFEHLRDNTGGKMDILKNDKEARLLLFNMKDTNDKHWAAALEVFFEERLSPEIKSERCG